MSSEKIIQFNDIVLSFINQLSSFIGTSYSKEFKKIIKYNCLLPIEQFIVHALPLRDKILNKDETYFTDEYDYNVHSQNDKNMINEILRLKDIYIRLDKKSKSNIWDYFQAMLILAEEYIQIKFNKHTY
jgi:hypothetical protein